MTSTNQFYSLTKTNREYNFTVQQATLLLARIIIIIIIWIGKIRIFN